jgi:hypothetical protein
MIDTACKSKRREGRQGYMSGARITNFSQRCPYYDSIARISSFSVLVCWYVIYVYILIPAG